eukprot:3028154-Ditylum_brightwellii.AAC.1
MMLYIKIMYLPTKLLHLKPASRYKKKDTAIDEPYEWGHSQCIATYIILTKVQQQRKEIPATEILSKEWE